MAGTQSPRSGMPAARRRGSTLTESAIVLTVFAILLAGFVEVALTGYIANSVTFAAHRAARFASVRGSSSGHAASVADIQAQARIYAAPLDAGSLAVDVNWTPDNHPGATVEVRVTYALRPALLPLATGVVNLRSVARQIVVQ